jgi:hypothetical protein
VRKNVLGEFSDFALNCEEIVFGGTEIWDFLGLWAGIHVGLLRRGTSLCVFLCVWGNWGWELSCNVFGVT